MKEIQLTQGKVALVDDEDFDKVLMHTWCASRNKNIFYAVTKVPHLKRKKTLKMHILIMGKQPELELDHVNHNGLDNRRCNLRHVTGSQNSQNRRHRVGTSSIYKGVSWYKQYGKWKVAITKNKIEYHIGYYASEQEAALAYNKEAIKLFGEFAYINKLPLP